MPVIYLSLGSNLGDRWANLQAGLEALPPAVSIQASSPVYETAPWGYSDQPAFLNQAVQAETQLDPYALLAHLKDIETQLGRRPTFRYGPRLIDCKFRTRACPNALLCSSRWRKSPRTSCIRSLSGL